MSPADRADNARQRINTLLDRGGEGRVSVESIPTQGNVIKVDDSLAFVLTEGDADPLLAQTLES